MFWQLLELAVYAAAACFAAWRSWHRDTRISGVALLICCVVSGVVYFTAPFGLVVICEIMLALFMAVVSAMLWAEGNSPRQHLTVMGLCAVDTAFCGLICWRGNSGVEAQTVFSHGADILFLGMCAAIAFPGALDAVWDRLRVGRGMRHSDRSPHVVVCEDGKSC